MYSNDTLPYTLLELHRLIVLNTGVVATTTSGGLERGEMKKLFSLLGVFFMLTNTVFASAPQKTEEEPIEIIETVRIEPNAEILAREYVTCTKDWDKNCVDTTIKISQEDAVRLMKIAQAEAGNQGTVGQLKVMEVVWNRTLSDKFPDSIQAVIEQDGQFESYSNHTYDTAEPTYETHIALAMFEQNRDLDSEIIGFETVQNRKSLERYFEYAYTVEAHDFYVANKK